MSAAKILRFFLITCILILAPFSGGLAAPASQIDVSQQKAQELLSRLKPEERVGQLFLVTFNGPEAAPGTPGANQIYDLITNYHVGGVILQQKNDNFVGEDRTLEVLQSLTDQLQRDEYSASLQAQNSPGSLETFLPAFIPLFIGMDQSGDGYPYDQVYSGMTVLPNEMTLGATWNPELAKEVGSVLGKELSILGINLFMGPSLDVLEPPFSISGGDLGVRTFGGDPFWVGEMGKAYITGLHEGSNNKIVAVGKHFPGYGGSDRLPEDEVATVRKTLEQLKQFELYPFFSVTGNAPTPAATVDALLTSHIRYQGFQENFRATTRPISFDPQAFAKLMALPELNTWRQNGGVMISDSLGSRAVRRFYDPSGETFNGTSVALDAFNAGNDVLYLDNFASSGDPDAYTTIVHTLASFALKYRGDTAFAQKVDAAVLRVLTLKYRLYGNNFSLNQSLPNAGQLNTVGRSSQITFEVARQAATLISPPQAELDTTIPSGKDKIVFITDARAYIQCGKCTETQMLAPDALDLEIMRSYSPQAGGQILPRNLVSYTFQDLEDMIQAGTGQKQIENDIKQANWIVFSMLDIQPAVPASKALGDFLKERPDLLPGKRLVVFAFNAPYYLDATDISKLTAYYGLYSRAPQFVQVAARLLFQEIMPSGNLPVSVAGVGYDLNTITFPDPNQVIPLFLDVPSTETVTLVPTPEKTQVGIVYQIGDTVPVRTGVIRDHNGHIVPDGTPVRFILSHRGDAGTFQQVDATTLQGIAKGALRVDGPGTIEIRVESDPAQKSETLSFVVPSEIVTITPVPTSSITPTVTPSITVTPTPTKTAEPTQTSLPPLIRRTEVGDWFGSLLVTAAAALVIFLIANRLGQVRWGVRSGFVAFIGGLLVYSYLALELPGSAWVIQKEGFWGIILLTTLGASFAGGSAWLWWVMRGRRG